MDKKEFIAAGKQHVHPTPEALLDACSRMFALENMGMSLVDYVDEPNPARVSPERVQRSIAQMASSAYSALYHSSESDAQAAAIDRERKAFVRDLAPTLRQVREMGAPLTLASMEDAWRGRGLFAKG